MAIKSLWHSEYMPIFGKRRLCLMLTELSEHLDSDKYRDLSNRLEHTNTNTALAAEAELLVLWGISKVAHLNPEPELPNSTRKPDAGSDDFFTSGPAIIEIRALSDDSFSGKEAMDRTANIICGYADQLRKGAGKHLYFEFNERSYWTKRFNRERCVDPEFKLTDEIKDHLRRWIIASDWPNPDRIQITNNKTDVVISWKEITFRFSRTFCRMPPVAYDLEENPIYKALKKKSRQVKGASTDSVRCVVLVDAGCDLLRQLRPINAFREIGGEKIIRHALTKLSIDVVIVLSPYRRREFSFAPQSKMIWNVGYYESRDIIPAGEYDRLRQLAAQLPKPIYEGYQARGLHKQGSFSPENRNWYLPTKITTRNGGRMTIKLSAGLLHEYLAGRIDAERFRGNAFNTDRNFFDTELTRGNSIRQVQFEPGGTDEDDDYVVFDLDIDWDKIAREKPASSPPAEDE